MDEPGGERGPSSGEQLAGVLLMLFGLCLFLAGGCCTMIWIGELAVESVHGDLMGEGLLLLSVIVAGLGVLAIVKGYRLLRGRRGGPGSGGGSEGA